MTEEEARDVENQTSSPNRSVDIYLAFETCALLVLIIVVGVLLYCLLAIGTVVIVSIFFFINTILHIIDSMKGEAGGRRLVSPISNGAATIILIISIIILSLWLGIVHAVPNLKHQVLLGLQIQQWIKVLIIVLGYYSIRTGTQIINSADAPLSLHALLEAIYCVLLLPVTILIMNVVPSLRHHTILGMPTWNWICTLILVVVGQYAISMVTHIVVVFSEVFSCRRPEFCKGSKCVRYYLQGLTRSIIFALVALMHLIMWDMYFCPRFIHSALATKVADFVSWTFVFEFICGVLWGLKKFILLFWKARTIYARSNKDIMRKLTQWYCLSSLDLIKLNCTDPSTQQSEKTDKESQQNTTNPIKEKLTLTYDESNAVWEIYNMSSRLRHLQNCIIEDTQQKKKAIKSNREYEKWTETMKKLDDVVTRNHKQLQIPAVAAKEVQEEHEKDITLSIHEKELIASTLQGDQVSLPDHQNQNISKCLERWGKTNNLDKDKGNPEDESDSNKLKLVGQEEKLKEVIDQLGLEKAVENIAVKVLYCQLEETSKHTHAEILSEENVRTWMDRAAQNCLQMQYLLRSARDVLKFLNKLIIGFLIVLVIIIWLLVTEILPTRVIVVISSPLLAAAFIFGETLKTMFQGVVFAYVMHPFTIGDLCVVDETQMEVKGIGVWRTTFFKVCTEEKIMYPNSSLAKQAIINYAGDSKLVLQDFVEFRLNYETDETTISLLKDFIKSIKYKQHQLGGSPHNGSEGNAPAGVLQKENVRDTEPSVLESHSQGSAAKKDDPIDAAMDEKQIECDNHLINGSEPSAQADHQVPADHKVAQASTNDVMVVVKQIEDNIKMTVHFSHDKSILDLTSTKAFIEKTKTKSYILEEIAEFVSNNLQSSTHNAKVNT